MARRPSKFTDVFDRGSKAFTKNPKLLSFKPRQDSVYDNHRVSERPKSMHMDTINTIEELKNSNKVKDERISILLNERRKLLEDLAEKDDEIECLTLQLKEFEPIGPKMKTTALFLSNFLKKRPTEEEVRQKNYFKDPNCFNNDIENVPLDKDYENIPKIVVECIRTLEGNPNFMTTFGLYRASGNHANIQSMRCKIDQGKYQIISVEEDPHAITGLLKLFFRELKTPLLSVRDLNYAKFDLKLYMQISESEKIMKVGNLYESLPIIHQATLKFLINHLVKVVQIEENKMTFSNIAIVIGTCVVSDLDTNHSSGIDLSETLAVNNIIEIMIKYYNEIFCSDMVTLI